MKKVILLLIVASIGFFKTTVAQNETVKWHTIEEAIELNDKEPRKIFIDVYTDWCGWCKKMDAGAFANPAIAKILNEEYYAVKFNAEQKDDITFNGQIFKFVPSGSRGYHELAAAFLNNKLSYPSFAFLNEKNQMLTALPGYRTAKDIEPILMFLAEDAFNSQSFEEYQKTFKSEL